MASFGESLRREREMRGVTLEEISATTKINLRFLEAIETEDFAKLPGGIFTRSFVRAYAGYLGLDPERILAEYQLIAPTKPEGPARVSVTTLSQPGRGSLGRFLPLLVALPLLVGGYALYRYSHRIPEAPVSSPVTPAVPSPVSVTTPNTATSPSPQGSGSGATSTGTSGAANAAEAQGPAPSAGSESLTDTGKSPAGGQASSSSASGTAAVGSETAPANPAASASTALTLPKAAGGEGNLILQVMATERTWVAVDADGKSVFHSTLNPNDVQTFTAKDSFDVLTGNAQGTVLILNGTRQKSLGREGESKRIHFARESPQQPAP